MVCEVLSFGRCKSFFAHVQTLTWKQDFQWQYQQHCHDYSNWQYCTGLPNQTNDGWVVVNFLWNAINKKAVTATALIKWDISNLHLELGHPSEAITRSTTKFFGIQLTSIFKPCENCALGKAKQWAVSKKAVPHSQVLEKRLFFNISSPSTPSFGSKCHWLLVFDDWRDHRWSFFLSEKSNFTQKMLVLINNLI